MTEHGEQVPLTVYKQDGSSIKILVTPIEAVFVGPEFVGPEHYAWTVYDRFGAAIVQGIRNKLEAFEAARELCEHYDFTGPIINSIFVKKPQFVINIESKYDRILFARIKIISTNVPAQY